jgi:hypothetical protein
MRFVDWDWAATTARNRADLAALRKSCIASLLLLLLQVLYCDSDVALFKTQWSSAK